MNSQHVLLARILKGSAVATFLKICGAFLSYFMLTIIAQMFSPEDFGIFGVAMSTATFLSYVCIFGQQRSIIRFWAQYSKDETKKPAYLQISLLVTFIFFVVICIPAAAVSVTIFNIDKSFAAVTILFALALGASEILASTMRAEGYLSFAIVPKDIAWRVLVITISLLSYAGLYSIDVLPFLLLVVISLIVCTAPQLLVLSRYLSQFLFKYRQINLKEWASVSFAAWLVAVLGQLVPQASIAVIAIVLGPKEAGVYFALERTSQLISLGLNGINQFVGPMISKAYYSGEMSKLKSTMFYSSTIGLLVGALGMLLFYIFDDMLIGIFVKGSVTLEMSLTLFLLGFSQLVNAATGPVGWLMQLTGREYRYLTIMVICNSFGLASMLPLTHYYGIIGAAVSTCAIVSVWNIWAMCDSIAHIRKAEFK